jgi:tetratricopeptide (TPR) repeat protein
VETRFAVDSQHGVTPSNSEALGSDGAASADSAAFIEAWAAVAEALHVDGHYGASARAWEGLAEAGGDPGEARLKAALALLSEGRVERGLAWLESARQGGLEDAEYFYVQGQVEWQHGRLDGAAAAFQRAMEAEPHRGTAANALGVLCARRGRGEEARRYFHEAHRRDSEDTEALVNLASLALREAETEGAAQPLERVAQRLERAARRGPHRPEPYVLASRLFRLRGAPERAQAALIQGRIRRHGREPGRPGMERGPNPLPRATGEVMVEIQPGFDGEDMALALTYRCRAPREARPRWLAVNPGYQWIAIGGEERRFEVDPTVPQEGCPGLLPGFHLVALAARDWCPGDGGGDVLKVALRGHPTPPCVAFRAHTLEFAEPSAWLPLPLPRGAWAWRVTLAKGATPALGWIPHISSTTGETDGIALLAMAREHCREATVDAAAFGWPNAGPVRALGPLEPGTLRFAAYLAARTGALWHALAGARREACPPLLIVEASGSDFCYTRPGFLRVASGVLAESSKASQICHEIGHLWWGADVRLPARDAWLSESLAEYSLHLGEDAGLAVGYRARVLTRVFGDAVFEPLADLGLTELARRSATVTDGQDGSSQRSSEAWAAAAVLRYKGGFVMSMLRQVMGEEAFGRLLRCAYRLGRTHELDAYTFIALAGRFHGHSLNWFFNQWVDASAAMTLELSQPGRVSRKGAPDVVEDPPVVSIERSGPATPGVPVAVAVYTTGGGIERLTAPVELGRCRLVVPRAVRRVILDPERRWFARPEQREISFESGGVS